MNTKHTAGPWKIDDALDLPLAVIQDNEMGEGIAELGERTPENEANARLIAAAPELLEALQEMMSRYGSKNSGFDNEETAKARAAIAKAKGEA